MVISGEILQMLISHWSCYLSLMSIMIQASVMTPVWKMESPWSQGKIAPPPNLSLLWYHHDFMWPIGRQKGEKGYLQLTWFWTLNLKRGLVPSSAPFTHGNKTHFLCLPIFFPEARLWEWLQCATDGMDNSPLITLGTFPSFYFP